MKPLIIKGLFNFIPPTARLQQLETARQVIHLRNMHCPSRGGRKPQRRPGRRRGAHLITDVFHEVCDLEFLRRGAGGIAGAGVGGQRRVVRVKGREDVVG